MSHHSTHLRILAKSTQDPKTSMDPTHKKHPKSPPFITTTTITTTTKPHPKPQEPTNIYSPNVQNISNHFSRLYSNHKALSSSNPLTTGPPLDPRFQAKPMSLSTISDGPVSKGTRKYRRNVTDLDDESPKASLGAAKKLPNKPSEENLDTKREIKTDDFKKSLTTKKEIVVVETKNQEIEVLKRPSVLVGAGGRGRRRSFCSSKTELADFLSCNGVKVVSADMPPFMQIHAVDFARKTYDSLEKFTAKTLASTLKKVPPLLVLQDS